MAGLNIYSISNNITNSLKSPNAYQLIFAFIVATIFVSTVMSVWTVLMDNQSPYIVTFVVIDGIFYFNSSIPIILISTALTIGIAGMIPIHLFDEHKTKFNLYLIHKKFKDRVNRAIDRLYY